MQNQQQGEVSYQNIFKNRDVFLQLQQTIPQTIENLKRAEQTRAMLWMLYQRISQQIEVPAISDFIAQVDCYIDTLLKCLFDVKQVKNTDNIEEEIPVFNSHHINDEESTSESNEDDKFVKNKITLSLKQEVNVFVLEEAMEKTKICIFDVMMDHGQRGLNDNAENERVMEEMIAYFLSANGKLSLLIELLPLIVYFNKNDLMSLPRYDERWRNLYRNSLRYRKLASDAELINRLKVFEKSIYLANSLCYKIYNIENKPLKQFMALVRSAQYFFFNEEARLITVKFQTNPDPKAAILVWDVIEQIKMWEIFVANVIDKIQYHEVIQIDANAYPTITEDMIKSEIESNTIYKRYEQEPVTKRIPQDKDIDTASSNKIQLRVLCAKNLQRRKFGQPLNFPSNNKNLTSTLIEGVKNVFKFSSKLKQNPQQQPKNNENPENEEEEKGNVFYRQPSLKGEREVFDEVIFHIHGGGWISMSSFSHQIYTRRWANLLKDVPIFSIDYKLLPQNKYPAAVADCFQAYCWILFNAEDYYNIKINKIILAGDSAGANMSLGVCLLAHKHGIRQPDGLLLCYPAVNLSTDIYTPSFLTSLFDPIVPHTFLKSCVSMYVSNAEDSKKDPFLSPILFPSEIMKIMPAMRIMVGEDDSLHDDTIRFTEKLVLSGHKNVKTIVYNLMRHGFLNYDYPFGFDSSLAIQDTGIMLAELLDPVNTQVTY
ncbi:hypothetical protein ABPG74_015794 [Tetrahymena malaccensis]